MHFITGDWVLKMHSLVINMRPFLLLLRLGKPFIRKEPANLARAVLHAKSQGECLKASAVGEQRLVEIHELVQTAPFFDHIFTRPEMKMVGVCQRNLKAQVKK